MFDRLKNVFGSAACSTGMHSGSWTYDAPDTCDQTRHCPRCGETHTRVQHSFGEWSYVATDDCHQTRTCQRCGVVERRKEQHQWGKWKYLSEDDCDQKRTCPRCQKYQKRHHHNWQEWKYYTATACGQSRVCSRCEIEETGHLAHNWGDWALNPLTKEWTRTCYRCMEEEQQAHQVSDGK